MLILLFALNFELSWEKSPGEKKDCLTHSQPINFKRCPHEDYVFQGGKVSESWKIEGTYEKKMDSFEGCAEECNKNSECQAIQWNPDPTQKKCTLIKKGFTDRRVEDNIVNCGFVFCSKIVKPIQLCIGDVVALKSKRNDYIHKAHDEYGPFLTTKKMKKDKTTSEMSFRKNSKWIVTGKKRCKEETDCKIKLKSSSLSPLKHPNPTFQQVKSHSLKLRYPTLQQVGKRVELWDEFKNIVLKRTERDDRKLDTPQVFYENEDGDLSVRTDAEIRKRYKQAIKWTLVRIEKNCKKLQEEF